MIEIDQQQVAPRLASLFDQGMPASLRCMAVLEGAASGRVLTDDLAAPTWGAVQEAGSGTLYLGGTLDGPAVHRLVAALRVTGDVLVGQWPDDERWPLFPPDPDYVGATIEFTDRLANERDEGMWRAPAGCELRPMDRELIARCTDRDYYAAIFGGLDQALVRGSGLCLMRGDDIVCEAFAGPSALGLIEISTMTSEPHRRRGYATVTCAHLIDRCEARGYRTYWNCAKQNVASAALARKLGYRTVKEYKLLAWFKQAR